ncbi:MAG: imidazoleglycerol-phosphate dehydratase HisB [Syntrophomonadaceae bacterium]|nr:imidazoleglycerol-phosphate dehydratase HisB [Syntrophomonadaceae bacterium]
MDQARRAEQSRTTTETDIRLTLVLDGSGQAAIDSGIGFLDHMLHLLAVHSRMDIQLQASGDLEVDEHHSVEDIAICLGRCLREALGDKAGIRRYGEATIPMDEALVRVVLDISGRSSLFYGLEVPNERLGNLGRESVGEFFAALCREAGINMHIDQIRGSNSHHIVEAAFKALARALRTAVSIDPTVQGAWSSKGNLD